VTCFVAVAVAERERRGARDRVLVARERVPVVAAVREASEGDVMVVGGCARPRTSARLGHFFTATLRCQWSRRSRAGPPPQLLAPIEGKHEDEEERDRRTGALHVRGGQAHADCRHRGTPNLLQNCSSGKPRSRATSRRR
jgi:hypothetical protein